MLNIIESINEQGKRIRTMEQVLGKGSMMPFNNANSGARKLMQSVQIEHAMELPQAEPALIQTGTENRFGEYSSMFIVADADYEVIAKIDKFSYNPDKHYYLIIRNLLTNEYDIIERISYQYITESYGIMFNNDYIDKLQPGSIIKKDDTIKKTIAYDECNNRQDGVNLTTAYIACEHTKEDSIIIDDYAAEKMGAPLIKKVQIVINDNDIPLNLFGNENLYKIIPDIGEEIKGGILCATRRSNKDEALFSQSYYRLSQLMMSDEKYTVDGTVLDVNIYCNNTTSLDNYYNAQLKFYYDQNQRFISEFHAAVDPIINYKCSYDLQKMYVNNKKLLEGKQYIKDNVFSNIVLEIAVMKIIPMAVGDKFSNRYGGKGCVSLIKPESEMPLLDNGKRVHVILNPSGCVNRENEGQLIETSINFASSRVIDFINSGVLDEKEVINLYIQYLGLISPRLANKALHYLANITDNQTLKSYIDCVISQGIMISLKPITESVDIDKINYIHQHLPFKITQYKVQVPQRDSNGNIRYIEARRRIVAAEQYFYRLKQYAEEKFSATSLASTNIRNENTRSSSKKMYKTLYTKTPIKFGEMESGDLAHVGMEEVVTNLLLVSASPHARRLTEKLLTDNPFDINVQIDDESTNRGAEKLGVYLLVEGLRIKFIKRARKQENPIKINPIKFRITYANQLKTPIWIHDKRENFDKEKYFKRLDAQINDPLENPIVRSPIVFRKRPKEWGE